MKNDITNVELAERLETYMLMLAGFFYGVLESEIVAIVLAALMFFLGACSNHVQNKRISLQDKIDALSKPKEGAK